MADYIYLVQMDIPTELEDEFNRIYDTEHVPNIVKAPGVHGCTRYRLESTNAPGMARYAAVYDIDSPDVPSSAGWLVESEKGAWPTKYGRIPPTGRIASLSGSRRGRARPCVCIRGVAIPVRVRFNIRAACR